MIVKSEQFLFYFLFFAIPLQTRKILYSPGWYFNEWQSVSVYATDIILLALFAFWLANSYQKLSYYVLRIMYYGKNFKGLIQKPDFYLVLFMAAAAVSVINSSSVVLSAYNLLKLVEFATFYFYVKNYAFYKFGFSKSLLFIFLGGVFQAGIAVLQFLKQSDLGLRILGESVLAPDLTGVASFFNLNGEKIIRAYGATPHPNIVAAYLFLSIFSFYFLWFYKKIKRVNSAFLSYALILFGFFSTFSRVAIFLLFANFAVRGGLLSFLFKKNLFGRRLVRIYWFTGVVILIFVLAFWPEVLSRVKISSGEEAVRLRVFYNKESLSSFNLFGAGPGNFVNWLMAKDPNLPRNLFQPVHNIYLLIFSENGFLGLAIFAAFLAFLVKDFIKRTKLERFHHYSILLVFSSFLFLGFFDHFLWTLQQGRFLLWLVLALLTINENDDMIGKQSSSYA